MLIEVTILTNINHTCCPLSQSIKGIPISMKQSFLRTTQGPLNATLATDPWNALKSPWLVKVPQSSWLPSGKRLQKNYGKSPLFMGKLTISMAMFHSYFDITRGFSSQGRLNLDGVLCFGFHGFRVDLGSLALLDVGCFGKGIHLSLGGVEIQLIFVEGCIL